MRGRKDVIVVFSVTLMVLLTLVGIFLYQSTIYGKVDDMANKFTSKKIQESEEIGYDVQLVRLLNDKRLCVGTAECKIKGDKEPELNFLGYWVCVNGDEYKTYLYDNNNKQTYEVYATKTGDGNYNVKEINWLCDEIRNQFR